MILTSKNFLFIFCWCRIVVVVVVARMWNCFLLNWCNHNDNIVNFYFFSIKNKIKIRLSEIPNIYLFVYARVEENMKKDTNIIFFYFQDNNTHLQTILYHVHSFKAHSFILSSVEGGKTMVTQLTLFLQDFKVFQRKVEKRAGWGRLRPGHEAGINVKCEIIEIKRNQNTFIVYNCKVFNCI